TLAAQNRANAFAITYRAATVRERSHRTVFQPPVRLAGNIEAALGFDLPIAPTRHPGSPALAAQRQVTAPTQRFGPPKLGADPHAAPRPSILRSTPLSTRLRAYKRASGRAG